jgi:hypothetical protein
MFTIKHSGTLGIGCRAGVTDSVTSGMSCVTNVTGCVTSARGSYARKMQKMRFLMGKMGVTNEEKREIIDLHILSRC